MLAHEHLTCNVTVQLYQPDVVSRTDTVPVSNEKNDPFTFTKHVGICVDPKVYFNYHLNLTKSLIFWIGINFWIAFADFGLVTIIVTNL